MTAALRLNATSGTEAALGSVDVVALERAARRSLALAGRRLALVRGAEVEGPDPDVRVLGLAQLLREHNRPCVAAEFRGHGGLKRVLVLARQRDLRALAHLPPGPEGVAPASEVELEHCLAQRALQAIAGVFLGEGQAECDGGLRSAHLAVLSTLEPRGVLTVTARYRLHCHIGAEEAEIGVREVPITLLFDASQAGDWLGTEARAVPARRVEYPVAVASVTPAPDPTLAARVPLEVRAVAGQCRVSVEALSGMGPGSVLDLDQAAPALIELQVGEHAVARGELVVSAGRYAVLISDVVSGARPL